MSIREQVKELRELADGYKMADRPLAANTIYQAADTIEALSAKLAATNMERSDRYYSGGWIPCGERLPEKSGYYDVTIESKIHDKIIRATDLRCFIKETEYWEEKTEPEEFAIDEVVVAWAQRREPYRP